MIDTLMILLFPLLDFLPFDLPRFWLFRDRLRFPYRWIVLLCLSLGIANSALFYVINLGGVETAAQYTTLLRYGFILFKTLLSFYLIRDSFSRNMFTILLMISYAFFIFGNANFIETRFFFDFSDAHPYLVYNCARALLLLITYPFMLHFLNHTVRDALRIENTDVWKYMWKIPLMATLFGMLYCTVTDVYAFASWQFLISRYLMLAGSCYVSFVLLKILHISKDQVQLEAALHYADQTLTVQKKQYEALSSHMEDVRRARHDLRQHLAVIQSYLDRGDPDSLREYIDQYQKSLPLETHEVYCRNEVVNAIICCYSELAAQQGIRFEGKAEYPDPSPIPNTDIVVLLGNLLENAVEACARQASGEKWIRLHIKPARSAIAITLDNSFSGECRQDSGKWLSSKRAGPGVGIQSIEAIAEKYNGFVQFHTEKTVFMTSVFLNP